MDAKAEPIEVADDLPTVAAQHVPFYAPSAIDNGMAWTHVL